MKNSIKIINVLNDAYLLLFEREVFYGNYEGRRHSVE